MSPASRVLVLPILLSLVMLASVEPARATDLEKIAKLSARDAARFGSFGRSVALSGELALIGAPGQGETGAAYVYRLDGSTWVEEQKLLPSDGASGDTFGFSVALSDGAALIGAFRHGATGAAYVYRFDGSSWVEEQKLVASNAINLGVSVSLDGDKALVGDDVDDALNGAAYVFRFDGSSWSEEQKLTASDAAASDFFGYSVSLSGDVALIGAFGDDDNGPRSGSAYVFRYDDMSWTEEQKLTASDGDAQDDFGRKVALRGDVALVGAKFAANLGISSGAAYAYRFDGSGWAEEQKLAASDGEAGAKFGSSVALGRDVALIGAEEDGVVGLRRGAAYFWRYNGSSWEERQKLGASDGSDQDLFGKSVSLDDGFALIGAQQGDSVEANTGAAYAFAASCFSGTVNDGAGSIADVLYLNGKPSRLTVVDEGDLLWMALFDAPAGGNGKFVVHANLGSPALGSHTVLPAEIGRVCFPLLLGQGAQPVAVWNSIGKTDRVGASRYFDGSAIPDPDPAPVLFLHLWNGDQDNLPAGTTVTFQGVLIDPASTSPRNVSATNATVLEVR